MTYLTSLSRNDLASSPRPSRQVVRSHPLDAATQKKKRLLSVAVLSQWRGFPSHSGHFLPDNGRDF